MCVFECFRAQLDNKKAAFEKDGRPCVQYSSLIGNDMIPSRQEMVFDRYHRRAGGVLVGRQPRCLLSMKEINP